MFIGRKKAAAAYGNSVVVNAGKADIDGFELSATWRPVGRWTLTGNVTTIDARLKDAAEGLGAAGARLPNSARVAASLGAKTLFDLAGSPSYIGVSERYAGVRNAGFDGSSSLPNYRMPAYWLTDVQSGVDFQRCQVALYVRNAFNQRAQLGAATSEEALGGPVLVTPARPRTIGATLTVNF